MKLRTTATVIAAAALLTACAPNDDDTGSLRLRATTFLTDVQQGHWANIGADTGCYITAGTLALLTAAAPAIIAAAETLTITNVSVDQTKGTTTSSNGRMQHWAYDGQWNIDAIDCAGLTA